MDGLSVLTLVKRRSLHLARLIEGLRRSEVPPAELIVVDMDGDWVPPGVESFPIRVVILRAQGLPLARARNAAATAAVGDQLLFLDVDCVPQNSLVSMLSAELIRADQLVCVEVRYLGPGIMQDDWTQAGLLARGIPHPARHFPEHGHRLEENPGLFWSLAFGIRRKTFDCIKGFDESFHGYGAEDTDFGFRAALAGVPLCFLGGTGAFHQHHESYDPPLQHFDDIVRNAVLFHHKWQGWPMGGWLDAFEQLGLIRRTGDGIETLRRPTRREIDMARVNAAF
jgi:GT2 family glycosyltransferase